MRLSSEHIKVIKEVVKNCFGKEAKVYLFGSRVVDDKKGGDIDLYIETTSKLGNFKKKLDVLRLLKNKIGEQKIDIVVNNFSSAPLYIYEQAKKKGILL